MGNGAKAQQKRDRNAKEDKKAGSQLKSNAAAKNIICKVCRQDFQCTVKRPALEVHASDKHDKTYDDCFAA